MSIRMHKELHRFIAAVMTAVIALSNLRRCAGGKPYREYHASSEL